MRLTVSSLDSKKASTNIDNVYMDYATSNLHAGMCGKNKLRVYRELNEVFECKKYLYGVPDMGSKLLFRFRSDTHGLNEELGRHITSFLCGVWNLCKEKLYPEDFLMNTASNDSIERRVVNGRNAMAKRP